MILYYYYYYFTLFFFIFSWCEYYIYKYKCIEYMNFLIVSKDNDKLYIIINVLLVYINTYDK